MKTILKKLEEALSMAEGLSKELREQLADVAEQRVNLINRARELDKFETELTVKKKALEGILLFKEEVVT